MSFERIKAVYRRAVVLVAGGAALAAALWTAMLEQTPPMDCAEWSRDAGRLSDPQNQWTFYAARRQGVTLPPRLGTCMAGVCSIGPPDNCAGSPAVTYQISTGPFVSVGGSNWQVVKIEAHPLVAGRLKAFAEAEPGARWFESMGQVVSTCLSLTTAANCRAMIGPLHDCWDNGDGTLCRYGRLVRINGPGLATDGACAPGATSKPYPCVTTRGAGGAEADAARVWVVKELQ